MATKEITTADKPILMGTGTTRFSQPKDGSAIEYIKDSSGNFIPSGRTFGTNSDYFKRETNNFIDPSIPVARPLTIDRSIGKVVSDNRNVARDQYQANWNQKSASNPNGWTSTQDKIKSQSPGGTWTTDTTGGGSKLVEFDETSQLYGGYAGAPAGMVLNPKTGKMEYNGNMSGQEKLDKYNKADLNPDYGGIIPSNANSPYLKGYKDSNDLSKYGFTPSQPPQSPDPLAYAQWQAAENASRAQALEAKQAETVKDAKTLWAEQANAQYQEQANKGYSEWEKEVTEDSKSEANKIYSAAINPLNAKRDADLAKMEASLQGMAPNQRRIYEGYRRNIIMSQYDKALAELDSNYKENISTEASSRYKSMQDKVMEMKTLTPEEQDAKLKKEDLEKRTTEKMEKWNTENPDNQINKWQAEEMAKDEQTADPRKVDNVKALSELRMAKDDKKVDKFSKSMEITDGDVSEARTFWLKYLPKEEVDKQEEAYWKSKGYTKEQAEKAVTESDIVHLLMKPDEDLTAEDIQNLDTYQITNTESFDEAVWKLEQKKSTGKVPTATEVYKYRNQIQSNAALKKTGTGSKDIPKTESDKLYIKTVLPLIKNREDIINGYTTNDYTSEWGSLTDEEKNSMTPADKLQFMAIKTKQVPEGMKDMMLKAFDEQQASKTGQSNTPSNNAKNMWTSSLVKLGGATSKPEPTTKAGTVSSSQFDSLWDSTE